MRLTLLFLFALATSVPRIAAAQTTCHNFPGGGLSLRWDHCWADGGVANKAFACDTNSGSDVLFASFVLATPIANVGGMTTYIDLASSDATWPSWWQATSPGCRLNALTSSPTPDPAAVNCMDVWPAGAVGGWNLGTGYNGVNTRELRTIFAVPPGSEFTVPAGVEVLACRVTISHTKTVGTACLGCSTPMCIALSEVALSHPDGCDEVVEGPAHGADSHLATWQSAAIASASTHWIPGEYLYWYTTDMTCVPGATPARRSTWGSIHTLYR